MTLFNSRLAKAAPAAQGFLKARYMFLLMGMFAAFSGFCYNDFMAIPLWTFNSCYDLEKVSHNGHEKVEAIYKEDCVYPVGVDPTWYLSANLLTFVNSLKMKLSVILGVAQMALGVCMKGLNALYFKNKLDFYCEFVP